MTELVGDFDDLQFRLRQRNASISADMRPIWREALICLVVYFCHAKKCSIEQLHVICWALRSESNMSQFSRMLQSRGIPEEPVIREDPALDRAVRLALGETLLESHRPLGKSTAREVGSQTAQVSTPPYRLSLTKKGEAFVEAILSDPECFAVERMFLASNKARLGQANIRALFSWRR